MADTNPIEEGKIVSSEVSGVIKKFRLTIDDSETQKNNVYRSELYVSLDSKPNQEFTVQISNDSENSSEVITETLRYAYMNHLPVTIFHELPLQDSDQYRILMVQIGGSAEDQKQLPLTRTATNR